MFYFPFFAFSIHFVMNNELFLCGRAKKHVINFWTRPDELIAIMETYPSNLTGWIVAGKFEFFWSCSNLVDFGDFKREFWVVIWLTESPEDSQVSQPQIRIKLTIPQYFNGVKNSVKKSPVNLQNFQETHAFIILKVPIRILSVVSLHHNFRGIRCWVQLWRAVFLLRDNGKSTALQEWGC